MVLASRPEPSTVKRSAIDSKENREVNRIAGSIQETAAPPWTTSSDTRYGSACAARSQAGLAPLGETAGIVEGSRSSAGAPERVCVRRAQSWLNPTPVKTTSEGNRSDACGEDISPAAPHPPALTRGPPAHAPRPDG